MALIYKAPDGTVLFPKQYPEIVSYECPCTRIPEGIYESTETQGAATPQGIRQIQIKRTVQNNRMYIEIRESSEQELIDYKNSLITEQSE